MIKIKLFLFVVTALLINLSAYAQIGTRFPSERKVIKDPVTGATLIFLTSTPVGDSKIYQTHNQWTADGQWIIFRSHRVKNEAMAVNEKTGAIVQVTEGGYMGMLNVARKQMKLFFMRRVGGGPNGQVGESDQAPLVNPVGQTTKAGRGAAGGSVQIVEVDLAKLFADSEAGALKPASAYQRVCGTTPAEIGAGGDMALDGAEDWAYFRVGRGEAAKHLAPGIKLESNYGPRGMGQGPSGIAGMNIKTGEIKYVVSVPFQVGHIQTNPWVPGEIIFCWETGGKSPQRTWTVMADGSGLRPMYPEANYEWVTHEAVITKDEVAIAIMGHRKVAINTAPVDTANKKPGDPTNPGQENGWGNAGTREKPTGLGIVNLRSREMTIIGQTPSGSGLWHVGGSADGKWAVGDDFSRSVYLIDRHTREMIMLSTGHKATAGDHPHPTFKPDGTEIEIQSAMLSADNHAMNICIIKLPEDWLKRNYK